MASKPFVITRTFDAPRKLVWESMTDAGHLKRWFGPTGQLDYASVDLREGGVFLYGIAAPDGRVMRAKRVFTQIDPPEKFVTIASYCDDAQNVARHPMSPAWPLEMLIATTLTEQAGETHMLLDWRAHNATPEEQATFGASHAMLKQGWDRAFDNLDTHLKTMRA
ncbi:MAG: SRPBCC domain-containing protein [Proteobacteria bacterium]|nr:SRPBCC domain-containing protein [Pseudomonadota bacterium]